MSKIIWKLNAITNGHISQPMGFRTEQGTADKTKMLLIASLTNIEYATPDNLAGADAAVLYITRPAPVASFFNKINEAITEIPWGCQVTDTSRKLIDRLVESGCDFMIFPAESTVFSTGSGKKPGKILQIDTHLSDSLTKAINDLPVDAVLAGSGAGDFLNWKHLMSLQRLSALLRKPLLSAVPQDVKTEELRALWEIGVDGVLLAGDESSGNLQKLRHEIEKFPPAVHRHGRADALLPSLLAMAEATEVEEGEEEEEEE